MLKQSTSASLDKYYTKPSIAEACYKTMASFINEKDPFFIEPSAGNGSFIQWLPKNHLAFDIKPESADIIEMDFLGPDLIKSIPVRDVIVIGNPPFGSRSDLAIKFLNRSLDISDLVGFILPISFRKWSIQSKVVNGAHLIWDETLPDYSFLLDGKDYDARCCFQIWSMPSHSIDLEPIDLRLRSKPTTSHPDFELYQYNCTVEAQKYFGYKWDVAIPRQGFCDYSIRALSEKDCDRKKQWIFIKTKNKEVLDRILSIDYDKLSKQNIGTPGFGKADLIKEYARHI